MTMLRSVVARGRKPARRRATLRRCWRTWLPQMSRGRGQPGAIEIPIDLQYADVGDQAFVVPTSNRVSPDQAALSAAVELAEAVRGGA